MSYIHISDLPQADTIYPDFVRLLVEMQSINWIDQRNLQEPCFPDKTKIRVPNFELREMPSFLRTPLSRVRNQQVIRGIYANLSDLPRWAAQPDVTVPLHPLVVLGTEYQVLVGKKTQRLYPFIKRVVMDGQPGVMLSMMKLQEEVHMPMAFLRREAVR